MSTFLGKILPVILIISFIAGGGRLLYKTLSTPREVIYIEETRPDADSLRSESTSASLKYTLEETPDMENENSIIKSGGKSSDTSELESLIDEINKETDTYENDSP